MPLCHRIEVCMGPNCSAGGAALLDIEELIQEYNLEGGDDDYTLEEGGCRDRCSMGPNVYCDSAHYPKMNSPDKCVSFAEAVGLAPPPGEISSSPSAVGTMMQRKADRMRWKILREIINASKQKSARVYKSKVDEWRKGLREAYSAELSAVKATGRGSQASDRAARRLERLEKVIDGRFESIVVQQED